MLPHDFPGDRQGMVCSVNILNFMSKVTTTSSFERDLCHISAGNVDMMA